MQTGHVPYVLSCNIPTILVRLIVRYPYERLHVYLSWPVAIYNVCVVKRYQVLWINHSIYISYQMLLATEVIHYLFHASHLFSIYWYCVFLFRDAQATHSYGMWCSRCVWIVCFTHCKWLLVVLCKPHTKSWTLSQESVDASGLWQHMTASAVKHRF